MLSQFELLRNEKTLNKKYYLKWKDEAQNIFKLYTEREKKGVDRTGCPDLSEYTFLALSTLESCKYLT